MKKSSRRRETQTDLNKRVKIAMKAAAKFIEQRRANAVRVTRHIEDRPEDRPEYRL